MEDQFLQVAKQAAKEAGKVIMARYGKNHKLIIKSDRSDFTTQADLASEKTIVEIIKKNFPSHNIIAEEKTNIDNKSDYTWVIDPVDGTISFASDMPFFSVSIGLLYKKEPIMGVIYHVAQKDLYWAQKGKGAYLNNKRIFVSKTQQLKDSVVGLAIGTITRRRAKLESYFYPLLDKVLYIYMQGGGVVTMAFVARGWLDACPTDSWVWDHAAAGIIIPEAGGKITDRFGNPIDWSVKRTEFICSNGSIHNELLEALK